MKPRGNFRAGTRMTGRTQTPPVRTNVRARLTAAKHHGALTM